MFFWGNIALPPTTTSAEAARAAKLRARVHAAPTKRFADIIQSPCVNVGIGCHTRAPAYWMHCQSLDAVGRVTCRLSRDSASGSGGTRERRAYEIDWLPRFLNRPYSPTRAQ